MSGTLTVASIERLEAEMLKLPQADAAVMHHFGPGVYLREVSMKAGTFAIGHHQKHEHYNVLLKGRVLMLRPDGTTQEAAAPMTYTGQPGRKMGYVLEDTVWLNVYPNTDECRDVDELEARWLDKSPAWLRAEDQKQRLSQALKEADRKDFYGLIDRLGFTPEAVRGQSENAEDCVEMPPSGARVTVRRSPIEGFGVFLSAPVEAGETIAPARINGLRTPAGRYTNHSTHPNAVMVKRANGDIDLVATQPISGCTGGDSGEEVTIDYRQAIALSGITFREHACLA